jgi:hypothetical protein
MPRFVSRLSAGALLAMILSANAAPTGALTGASPSVLDSAGISQATAAQLQAAAQAQQVSAPSPAMPAEIPMQAPQRYDYSANRATDVFGASLFSGSFAAGGATQFNPDYMVAVGDRIQIRLWGGYTFDGILTVDPQGNLFVPQLGPRWKPRCARCSAPTSTATPAWRPPSRCASTSAASSTARACTTAPAWTACSTTWTRRAASTSSAAAS